MRVTAFFLLAFSLPISLFSQTVGIGTTTPHPSAVLDVSGSSGGLLIPRMNFTERNAIASPAKGLIVFITNDSSLYYFDGNWQKLVPASQCWNLNGNALSTDSSFFIGTTNPFPLRVKVNNQNAGLIDSSTRNHTWGYRALLSNTTGIHNSAFGSSALQANTTGYENIAIGNSSMISNTEGFANIGIGFLALSGNKTGYSNIAIGKEALYGSQEGNNNVSIGGGSMFNNFDGSFNTALGYGTLFNNARGNYITVLGFGANVGGPVNNATAVGANAVVDEANKIVLGDNNIKKVQTTGTIIAAGYTSGKTTAEILAISSPMEGTIIYNTTTHRPVYYNGSAWKYFDETNL
jgi:hypothetical protein